MQTRLKEEIIFVQNDLPSTFLPGNIVAIDTEAMGLNPFRDRTCLIQITNAEGECYVIQLQNPALPAVNLQNILEDKSILKLFHFARFDMTSLYKTYQVMPDPVYCTRMSSKLVRTYSDRHSLKELCRELLGVTLNKHEQSSDWGSATLTQAQKEYAAGDVKYLHRIYHKLVTMSEREGRSEIIRDCCGFLGTRVKLDLLGLGSVDIFNHI